MSSLVIDVSDLRGQDAKKVKELAEFLKDKVDMEVKAAENEVVLSSKKGEEAPTRRYLRVLIRKFLHRAELREEFRLISAKEGTFKIKRRKSHKE